MSAPLPDLELYGRPGCHLCEEARSILDALLVERAARGLPVPALVEHDIEGDEVLHGRYLATIPVVRLGDRQLDLATSPERLRRLLRDVLDAGFPG